MRHNHFGEFISYDIFSLLPKDHRNLSENDEALVQTALSRQNNFINRQVIFLISDENEINNQKVKQAFINYLNLTSPDVLNTTVTHNSTPSAGLNYYAQHWQHIASPQQLSKLQNASEEQWMQAVQARASSPFPLGLSIAKDPLGNIQDWLFNQSKKITVSQNSSGDWQVDYAKRKWIILSFQIKNDAFSLNLDHSLLDSVQKAKEQILQIYPKTEIHMAGVALHAASSAQRANFEINLFGSISFVAVIILLILAYHSIKAVFAVTFSLLYGSLLAFFSTYLIFGQIHITTLVFGTSLIGVAEDYAFHFLAARQNNSEMPMNKLKQHIAPSMFLAFITTAVAYIFLGLPPFSALRQLAVFSVTGLLGSLFVVWILFPFIFRTIPNPTPLNKIFALWWRYFVTHTFAIPSWLKVMLAFIILSAIIVGWTRIKFKDDLRQLQNSPTWLMREQQLVGQALNEVNSQFFLVTGDSEQSVLQHEEQLRAILDQRMRKYTDIQWQYRAVSEWLPSIQAQKAVEQSVQKLLPIMEKAFGFALDDAKTSGENKYINPKEWLQQPFSQQLQKQWLGRQPDGRWATQVNLTGKLKSEDLIYLQKITQTLPHVLWVDNVSYYGQLLTKYRNIILWLLAASYFAVGLVLWPRYRRNALWLLVPPLVGSFLTFSMLGWLGIHIQLFSVLPLLLILGMGIDYGIFLVEHVKEQERIWMVTCMSTFSTILSLGMLGFSSTPALHILGVTLGLGITLTWLSSAWVGKWLSRYLRTSGA